MKRKATFAQELSTLLVKNRVKTEDQAKDLQKAFAKSSLEVYEDFLLDEGLVGRDDILQALSQYYAVPAYDVLDHFFETNLLRKYPQDFLVRNSIIPLEVDENMIIIVAAEPEREGLESAIRNYTSYDVNFFVGINQDILDAIDQYYDQSLTVEPQESDLDAEERLKKQAEELEDAPDDLSDQE